MPLSLGFWTCFPLRIFPPARPSHHPRYFLDLTLAIRTPASSRSPTFPADSLGPRRQPHVDATQHYPRGDLPPFFTAPHPLSTLTASLFKFPIKHHSIYSQTLAPTSCLANPQNPSWIQLSACSACPPVPWSMSGKKCTNLLTGLKGILLAAWQAFSCPPPFTLPQPQAAISYFLFLPQTFTSSSSPFSCFLSNQKRTFL